MEFSMLYMATLDDIAIKAMQGMLASGEHDRIVVARNAWAMAKQMIIERESLRQELTEKKKKIEEDKKLDERPIYPTLNIGLRYLNCLRSEDIETVGELTYRTVRDLRKVPNLGMKGIKQIQEQLSVIGLTLKGTA